MDSDDKRDFYRMQLHCPMEFKISGDKKLYSGQAINISSTGILFTCEQKLSPGTLVEMKVPANLPTNVLLAVVKVIRVEANQGAPGYRVAGTIEKKIN